MRPTYEIQADPAGVIVTITYDLAGPVNGYVSLEDIDEALAWIATSQLDRAYLSGIGVVDESDLMEWRAAVLAAQARHEELYADEAGRG